MQQVKTRKETFSLIYKAAIVLAVIIGILLQCEVGTSNFSLSSFRMFTTLSNCAVAVFFVVYIAKCLIEGQNQLGKAIKYFKFLITLSIMLTGLVAHFMLQGLFDNMASEVKVGLTLLHYVVPIAVVLDWIIFDEKGKTEWKMPFFAAAFPILYVIVTMIAAPLMPSASRYPYPFLNVDALGVPMVALNIVLLAIAFLTVGFLGVWLDHKLGKRLKQCAKG